MPLVLKEFGCGHSIRTGTQICCWITIIVSILGLFEINFLYFMDKKIKGPESSMATLLIFNFVWGIISSLSGLYGAYHNRRLWLKSFFVYLLCQFVVVVILLWIFFMLIYPDMPPFPRKTRFMILSIILFVTVFFGLLAYAALNVYSYHRHLSEEITGSEYMVTVDNHNVIEHEEVLPSNMSSVSETTTRSYLTTTQFNERHQRFLSNLNPPNPVPEESHTSSDYKELLND